MTTQSKQQREDATIRKALRILEDRIQYATGPTITSPDSVKAYMRLQLADKTSEAFGVLFMDNRHQVIEYREMFQGTVDGASVYPREVVKAALETNAAAVVLSHNHPSGIAVHSKADERITMRLKEALALIDVRVLDHLVIGETTFSFAEAGLL